VDETIIQATGARQQGPYREVLDWLVEQIERLDAHRVQLAAEAERGEVEPTELAGRQAAIEQAHDWLADQLRQALVVRGMQLAA
jgi:hypothetical protein